MRAERTEVGGPAAGTVVGTRPAAAVGIPAAAAVGIPAGDNLAAAGGIPALHDTDAGH